MSPGLQRARQPFRIRNALTGVILGGFAVGVWAYSIGAVKQDVFDDVDEEARALRAGAGDEAEGAAGKLAAAETAVGISNETPLVGEPVPAPKASTTSPRSRPRGILPPLLAPRFPNAFDPSTGTLVWGAPSVDNVGRLWDRRQSRKTS